MCFGGFWLHRKIAGGSLVGLFAVPLAAAAAAEGC